MANPFETDSNNLVTMQQWQNEKDVDVPPSTLRHGCSPFCDRLLTVAGWNIVPSAINPIPTYVYQPSALLSRPFNLLYRPGALCGELLQP